ncbi:MAG: LptF/LptG family permease [Pirellulaceae bacterium]|nr:LptF/LptG family permease [Pirellulaceae bacterium]
MLLPHRFTIYVLGDVIQLFLVTLIGMTTFIMLGLVLHQLYSEGLGLSVFTQMLPYASVMSLQFAIPATLLFSVCTVFGRLSADNELVAVKSAGISPMRIIQPTLIFALLMSPLAVWMNDMAVSWGSPGIKRIVLNSLEEIVYAKLRAHRSYTSQQGLTIYVQDVEDRWLIRPRITIYGSGDSPTQKIDAAKARLSLNPTNESLTIELIDYEFYSENKIYLHGGKAPFSYELPLSKAAQKNSPSASASFVSLRDMGNRRRQLESEMDESRVQMLTRCSLALASGRLSMLHDAPSNTSRYAIEDGVYKMQRLRAEPWRRWAQGFSCLCFVWLGIPLAILRKSADYTATFGFCFLPILLLYYPLFIVGVDQSKSGEWHPSAPWLANGVLLIVGAWMMRKVYCE